MNDLHTRQRAYEDAYDYQIISRIPVIIRITARNFKKLTSDLKKPFCPKIMDAMAHTLLYVVTEISNATFGYRNHDEINIIILQHSDEPWLQNRVQKISSTAASLATLAFNRFTQALEIETPTDPIFYANTFGVPSINESINYLIDKQSRCVLDSLHEAAHHELSQKYSPKDSFEMLQGRSFKEKQELLKEECDIDFEDYYPIAFRRGISAYKAPSLNSKVKWVLDLEMPLILSERDWAENILRAGKDIFRERDFNLDK